MMREKKKEREGKKKGMRKVGAWGIYNKKGKSVNSQGRREDETNNKKRQKKKKAEK